MTSIAILIPCHNEEPTIAKVIQDFRQELPNASIYVCDNNSSDDTARVAHEAGAVVLTELRQGKGHALRRLFGAVRADIYLMVDGDATYDAPSSKALIARLCSDGHDMVIGRRVHRSEKAYRPGHQLGNRMITWAINAIFGNQRELTDVLSGYRSMTRRFVETFPLCSAGFDIETELTVHALHMGVSMVEIDTPYYERPAGSTSKLSTYKDGFKIGLRILALLKSVRPMLLFGLLAGVFALIGGALGGRVLYEFLATGMVLAIPSAILATGTMLLSMIFMTSGIVLHGLATQHRELKLLHYLSASDRTHFDFNKGHLREPRHDQH